MRHSDIRLTMGVYTDPKLLDVRGALEALPALQLDHKSNEGEAVRSTGTDGKTPARTVAPTTDKSSTRQSFPDKTAAEQATRQRGGQLP
jgi:hypothetical protein